MTHDISGRHERLFNIIGFIVGMVLGLLVSTLLSRDHGPGIVVNMPAGAAPLESLAPLPEGTRIVPEDRAILWWTVFKYAMDKNYSTDSATRAADKAVDKAYR